MIVRQHLVTLEMTLRGVRKHFKYRHASISGTDKLENAYKEGELGSGLSMRYSQMEMLRQWQAKSDPPNVPIYLRL